jgi:hypothetical protein
LIEIGFGIVAIAFSASTMDVLTYRTAVLQIAAGVYIIVRGIDNLKIGLDARRDHWAWILWISVAYWSYLPSELVENVRVLYGRPVRWVPKAIPPTVYKDYRLYRFRRLRSWKRWHRVARLRDFSGEILNNTIRRRQAFEQQQREWFSQQAKILQDSIKKNS